LSALSAAQACKTARVTFRQIDYWARTGLLRAHNEGQGSGTWREFSETETRVAYVLGRLSAGSISPGSELAILVAYHVRQFGIRGEVRDRTGLNVVDLDALEDPFLARVA
jgi:hypothetical protein